MREDLRERRLELSGTPQERLYNEEKGIPRERLERIRQALRELWGEPGYEDDEVELYWKSREEETPDTGEGTGTK